MRFQTRGQVCFSDLFGIVFVAAALGAVASAAVLLQYSGSVLLAFLAFLICMVCYQAGLLLPTAVFNVFLKFFQIQGQKFLTIAIIPVVGVGVGFLLSQILVYPGPVTTRMGVLGGLVSGIVFVIVWIYVLNYRQRVPVSVEERERLLFLPGWLAFTSKRKVAD